MQFEFATANRVIFGAGAAREAGRLSRGLGRRALVVTGRDATRSQFLIDSLRQSGVFAVTFPVSGEPDLEIVGQGAARAVEADCDLVISIGGGSVLDAGKA